jgi:pimeloyl-ACP methyl ester carboxylesterase
MPPGLGALFVVFVLAPQSPPSVRDTLIDVGGYAMHLVVRRGSLPVTVVMESGGGDDVQGWAGVDSALARRTGATVVAYDRAGFGRSGTGPADLTPREQIRQLHETLERLGTPPARIVVGTSYGGMMAVLHAHLYPANVRGLVLADPMNPRFVRATGDFIYSTVRRIDQPVTGRDSAFVRLVRTFPAFVSDSSAGDGDLRIPIVVVTAGTPWLGKPDIERAWRASHEAIAAARSDRRLVVAEGSRHLIAKERPETIVEGVVSLMADSRCAGGPDPP